MSDLGLGEIITTPQKRDAIHVAVIPVVAKMELAPGWWVSKDGENILQKSAVGIVDPFLTKNVQKGETFWLFLKPNTVTGMRHAWEHPEFEFENEPTAPEVSNEDVEYITKIAGTLGYTYNEMMDIAETYMHCEYTYDNTERYKDIPSDMWEKFWGCYTRITGLNEPDYGPSAPFTCSC